VKKKEPTSEPQDEQAMPDYVAALDVPLDLLCEMAWRVGGYDKQNTCDYDAHQWSENVRRAYGLITLAPQVVWQAKQQANCEHDELNEYIERWYHRLSLDERESQRVSFTRGCILLNRAADAKGDRSIKKFRNAYDKGVFNTSKSMKKFEEGGFTVDELSMFDKMLSYAPKSATRDKPVKKAPVVKKVRKK